MKILTTFSRFEALTRSGRRIDLAEPDVSLIRARDLAEHLAKLPMYRGATWGFYSIAQHSCSSPEKWHARRGRPPAFTGSYTRA